MVQTRRSVRSRRTLIAASLGVALGVPALVRGSAQTPVPTEWQPVAELELPRSEYAATVLDGRIYIAGGFGAELSFDRYDPAADAWERLVDLPEPRHHLCLVSLGEHIYLAGGLNAEANVAQSTFWRFDPAVNSWESLPPLPQGARGSLGGGAIDAALYIVGGSSHDLSGPATNDLARFDPAEDRWDLLSPMPTAREHLGVAVANGTLIAVGGRDGSHEDPAMLEATELYAADTDTWSVGAPMPTPRAGAGVASDGSAIYVLGGERFSDGDPVTIGAVERYDPLENSWSQLSDMPVARHGVAAAIADSSLYAIGGSTLAGLIENVRSVDRIGI